MSISPTLAPTDAWQDGLNLLLEGRALEAAEQLRDFVASQPDSFEGHNFLGVALAQCEQHEASLPHLQRAVELRPRNAQTRCNLAMALREVNRLAEARAEWEEALRLDPSHEAAYDALRQIAGCLDLRPASTPFSPASPAVNLHRGSLWKKLQSQKPLRVTG